MILKLNGKSHFLNCDSLTIEKVGNGRFAVTMDSNIKFDVIGGRESGGAANEWFCHCPRLYGESWVATDSMIAAIKAGAQY